MIFFAFNVCSLISLDDRVTEGEWEKIRDLNIYWPFLRCPHQSDFSEGEEAKKQGFDPGLLHGCVTGTQIMNHHLLFPWVPIYRSLEPKQELNPRHFTMGCRCPEWCFQCCTKWLPLGLVYTGWLVLWCPAIDLLLRAPKYRGKHNSNLRILHQNFVRISLTFPSNLYP